MNNLAFIILCHKNPSQIKRLILSLADEKHHFFIHVDAKIDIQPFMDELHNLKNISFIEERKNGQWGDLGIVLATIEGLKQIIASKLECSHINLLSGQDYPIKSNSIITDFFKKNQHTDFIDFEPFPVQHIPSGAMERIEHYSFNMLGKRYTYKEFKYCKNLNIKGKLLNSALALLQFTLPKRRLPNKMNAFYGSQWWSLTSQTVKSLLLYLKEHPEYIKYHRYSLLPDEMFFQTLVKNIELRSELVNDNLRYILWENESSHPTELTAEHIPTLMESKSLFARKFEPETLTLDQIDTNIKSN